jgi:hypothetical protein
VQLRGNLDCEAAWSGVALPAAVARRISLYATLFAACAPDDGRAHELWVPAPIDPARLLAHSGWTPPQVRASGVPPAGFDLSWADPAARDANDRSRTLAIARTLGVALPGARLVGSLAELDAHLAGFADRAWIVKARWTAAGRDRARGSGGEVTGELRRQIARLLERFGPLVFEPWLDRVADLGVCGEIAADGTIAITAPHGLVSDPRGGFLGIELVPAIAPAIAASLCATARAVATRLCADTGYRGRFAIDAFVYRDGADHRLHPLCELNARHTFGWIARALGARLGIRRLGFDAAPAGAMVLIAPADDRVTAWCA